jgi:hypothetical protein
MSLPGSDTYPIDRTHLPIAEPSYFAHHPRRPQRQARHEAALQKTPGGLMPKLRSSTSSNERTL